MTWEGYSFEDAVIMSSSERKMSTHLFTWKHSDETRDTKLGPEEITVKFQTLGRCSSWLDETGIIRIGAEVKKAISLSVR